MLTCVMTITPDRYQSIKVSLKNNNHPHTNSLRTNSSANRNQPTINRKSTKSRKNPTSKNKSSLKITNKSMAGSILIAAM